VIGLRRWQRDGVWARILTSLQARADADGRGGQSIPGEIYQRKKAANCGNVERPVADLDRAV
jgi:hypothetical protein